MVGYIEPAEVCGLVAELCDAAYRNAGPAGHEARIEYRAAAALAAKDEEMKGWKKTATEYASELHSLRSQLAEARKAQRYLNDGVFVGLPDQEIARRARLLVEATRRALTGGQNG